MTQTICDRCRKNMSSELKKRAKAHTSVDLTVNEYDDMMNYFERQVDLCSACTDELLQFLDGRHLIPPDPLGTVLR